MRERRPEGWAQFRAQRQRAKNRGIPFLFTFEEWWAWWQVDGRWANRGLHPGGFVMARRNDAGPYALGNVYCATVAENGAEMGRLLTAEQRARISEQKLAMHAARPEIANHLRDRANHPMRKPVMTPAGYFPSAALAADHYGMSRQGVAARVRAGVPGWRYVAG